jgi:hypothetical protein
MRIRDIINETAEGTEDYSEPRSGYEFAQSQAAAQKKTSAGRSAFKTAFAQARAAQKTAGGDPSQGRFTWRGREYTTAIKGEQPRPIAPTATTTTFPAATGVDLSGSLPTGDRDFPTRAEKRAYLDTLDQDNE